MGTNQNSPFQSPSMGHRTQWPSLGRLSQSNQNAGEPAASQSRELASTRPAPGQPHLTGTRINRGAGRLESTICRCQNPNEHGDAFSNGDASWGTDRNGMDISWSIAMNRILDVYGTNSMTREQ
ncbi:hypothetical protein HBH56_152330 [Parastagonospora nodorum]|uniref:Uncharacterized protein n=1 Tax=Phaeosphaeria nodorum (strain SN15 / ATCC MYA-4574 / FGSC 10173) TaxID=321614 RepID=A0A7U2F0F9_PHANO|nr:hypothetical protein HBH56_152330 [Parastagonospora nodorum]QRC96097.1 hypothetical protein JI435_433300 [Parastagonospora nodorum SN15]KAH3926802.1 hypothetical protein HBH54_165350 [Parastagonospora nodorum]KAH3970352.1 hypothetical protein HBH52_165520 [Parastagonospora nodorum]KAH3972112.1 hypothetical protein HBH51_107660 [Parastagonospora nodorum]